MTPDGPIEKMQKRQGVFPVTSNTVWVLLHRSGTTEKSAAEAAFAEIYRRYALPVQMFARSLCRSDLMDAEDLTQEFFLKLFQSQSFKESEQRGKFRSLLCQCFRNHYLEWKEKMSAQKRGGGTFTDSLEAEIEKGESVELSTRPDAGENWDLLWAQRKFQLARERLRTEYQADHKDRLFNILIDNCAGGSGDSYAELAILLDKSAGSVKKDAQRMRERLQECFYEEVALDFQNPIEQKQQIEDEADYLARVLCGKAFA